MECYSPEKMDLVVLDREFWKNGVSYGFDGLEGLLDVLLLVLSRRSSERAVLRSHPHDIRPGLAQRERIEIQSWKTDMKSGKR